MPFDTWLTLAVHLDLDALVAAGDFLVTERDGPALLALDQLKAGLEDANRTPGLGRARRAAPLIRAGAWSVPETLLRLLVVRAGFGEPHLNAPIGGTSSIADLPDHAISVEYNGAYHDDPRQRRRDLRRAEEIVRAGWITVNVDRDDLFRNPTGIVTRLAAAFRSRGASVDVRWP